MQRVSSEGWLRKRTLEKMGVGAGLNFTKPGPGLGDQKRGEEGKLGLFCHQQEGGATHRKLEGSGGFPAASFKFSTG